MVYLYLHKLCNTVSHIISSATGFDFIWNFGSVVEVVCVLSFQQIATIQCVKLISQYHSYFHSYLEFHIRAALIHLIYK